MSWLSALGEARGPVAYGAKGCRAHDAGYSAVDGDPTVWSRSLATVNIRPPCLTSQVILDGTLTIDLSPSHCRLIAF